MMSLVKEFERGSDPNNKTTRVFVGYVNKHRYAFIGTYNKRTDSIVKWMSIPEEDIEKMISILQYIKGIMSIDYPKNAPEMETFKYNIRGRFKKSRVNRFADNLLRMKTK